MAWRLAALLLAMVQLPVLFRTGADPSQSDFANYFTPAFVLSRGGDVGALYDRDTFDRGLGQAGLRGLGSFIPHPPANALWLLPFARQRPEVAKGLWSGVLVLAIAVTILIVARFRAGLGLAMATALVLAPTLAVRNSLAFGQPYLILAALLALGVLSLERGREFLGGFLLGLGVSFKPYGLLIGALFVDRERRHALGGFVLGAAVPSIFLWSIAGSGPFVEFSAKVLPWMLKGDIQDPFSPVWGSATALANRLFRFEPDLNPLPWLVAPRFARFCGAAASAGLLALGVMAGRKAIESGGFLDAVGIGVAFALAASPFTASYHLVLLVVPVAGLVARHHGRSRVALFLGFALLGSTAMNVFRAATGPLAPLAYARFFGLLALALGVSWPFLNRRIGGLAIATGAVAGLLAWPGSGEVEAWPRIESAKGYTMMRPYFCGQALRWMSPSLDGRRLESHGAGDACAPGESPLSNGAKVVSRFTDGSWNLYRQGPAPGQESRLTFSTANEVDPVLTPDGCAVVFASDQGRGLGSTALYRIEVPDISPECAGSARASAPR